ERAERSRGAIEGLRSATDRRRAELVGQRGSQYGTRRRGGAAGGGRGRGAQRDGLPPSARRRGRGEKERRPGPSRSPVQGGEGPAAEQRRSDGRPRRRRTA